MDGNDLYYKKHVSNYLYTHPALHQNLVNSTLFIFNASNVNGSDMCDCCEVNRAVLGLFSLCPDIKFAKNFCKTCIYLLNIAIKNSDDECISFTTSIIDGHLIVNRQCIDLFEKFCEGSKPDE